MSQKKDQCINVLYVCIYIYIYLEPVCPLFWWLNPPKQGLFQANKGHLGSRYIYMYIYIYFRWRKTTPATPEFVANCPPMASPPTPTAPGRQHSDFHPLTVWKPWIPQWRNSGIWRSQHVKIKSHIKIGIFTDPWMVVFFFFYMGSISRYTYIYIPYIYMDPIYHTYATYLHGWLIFMGSVNIQSSHRYGNYVFIVTGCFNLYGNMINDQDSLLCFFWGSWGLSLLATWRTLIVDGGKW